MIFPNFILPILSRTSHSAFGFPALFRVLASWVDRCSAIRTWNVLHEEGEARNFNISALRGTNRRLLAAVMQKEKSLVELKAF